ncbi:MAG: GspH/FimT family pseudopilin [Alcanivorax sp.]|nr:GspH/FimT family pseudopilin [Alcanivorax sp.]
MIPRHACTAGLSLSGSRTRQRGVNAIELIVGLLIMGIVTAIALPSMQSLRDGADIRGTTSEFLNAINTARTQALNLRVDVELSAAPGGWSNGWDLQYMYPGTTPVAQRVEGDQRVRKSGNVQITGSRNVLIFQANGLLDGGGAVFALCREGRARDITISPLGRVTNQEGSC